MFKPECSINLERVYYRTEKQKLLKNIFLKPNIKDLAK